MINFILVLLFILFSLSFLWAFKQYREIKRLQYFEDEFHSVIMLGENEYCTGIRDQKLGEFLIMKQTHGTNFKSAKKRYRKLIKECRELNNLRLKNKPQGLA